MVNHPNRDKVKDWPVYLKEFRAKHGMTQKILAVKLMLSSSVVESWEAGRFEPPAYLKLALKWVEMQLPESGNE